MSDSKLSCSYARWVDVCVCVRVFLEGGRRGVGGEKKPLSLTPDDIFGSTSKVSQGGSERSVQATDRALLLLALLLKKIQASLWLSVYVFVCVCVMYACAFGGWCCAFFLLFFPPQTDRGSMKINNVSIPPEVLNSGANKKENKNITF